MILTKSNYFYILALSHKYLPSNFSEDGTVVVGYNLNQSGRMDEKTQRYLQRIEKIMLTPKKQPNQYRPSKSPVNCKTHNLDKYLKYELAATIIQKVISRNNGQFVTQCYNAIRASDYRQKERIYKFIPVEKTQSLRDMQVDSAISGKLLFTALKGLLRKKYMELINALQETAKSAPVKAKGFTKADRKTSVRESSGYSVLMRTTTRPELADYKMVSEWIDGTSNASQTPRKQSEVQKKDDQKTKQLGLKIYLNLLGGKIKNNYRWAMYQMRKKCMSSVINDPEPVEVEIKHQQAKVSAEEKVCKFTRISIILIKIRQRRLINSFNIIRQRGGDRYLRLLSAFFLLQQRLKTLHYRHKFQNQHSFFSALKERLSAYQKKQLAPKSQQKSQKNNQIGSSQSSQVEAYNPLVRLNFYTFVDKIFKFILIISKLLVPIKEAFVKIDHYASFAYKLEQSLKVVPKRYLQDSFDLLKKTSKQKLFHVKNLKNQENPAAVANQFYSIVLTSIHQRLIEGFIHIKIISRERTRKAARKIQDDSIIQSTKRFIIDRESYTSHSYESWSELKSTLLPPKSSSQFKYGRHQSSILA